MWQEMDYDYEDPLDPRASEWYDTEGYDNESYPDETGWTEDFYETDDYDPNDSTFSDHFPALLDQPVEAQEGDTSKLETVQEAVAAANAAADMSWTQARTTHERCAQIAWPLSPVSKGNSMEVDQGKGKTRGNKGRTNKGKGKHRGKSKGKGKGRRPGATAHHIMEERVSAPPHLARDPRTLHRFDKLTWKVTNMIGSQVQVLLQSQFHLCRILYVLISTGSLFSTLEPQCPWEALICCREFKNVCACWSSTHFTSRVTTSFLICERARGRVDECSACAVLALESHISHSSVERARTSAVGSRCTRRFGTRRRSCRLLRVFESLEAGRHG